MNDLTRPQDEPAGDGELLSAYLAGDLDEAADAALETRLVADADLRQALERQRAVAERFAALSPSPPAGSVERLRARLDKERGLDTRAEPEGARADVAAAPISLDTARARRREGRPSWLAVGSVAAAFVLIAVVGAGVLGSGLVGNEQFDVAEEDTARDFLDEGTDSGDMETLQATEERAAADEAADDSDMATMDAPAGAADGAESAADASAGPGAERTVQPEIVDDGVVLADEGEVGAHLSGRPEVAGLLGADPDEAHDLAAAFSVAVRSADAFRDGTRPDTCLDTVTDGAAGPVVPARVERLVYEGMPALAYVLVTSAGGDAPLDRVEAWIVEPGGTCATLLFLVLPS